MKSIKPDTYTTRETCRVCHSRDLEFLFSLGEQYVSAFVEEDQISTGLKVPIDLEICHNCTLVQAKHTAPQELLYARKYWYRSGVTDTMKRALRDVTVAAQRYVDLNPGDVVLDVGSNDGTLLRAYEVDGIVKVGVEPATNLAEEGSQGVDVFINDFWSAEDYRNKVNQHAKIITAIGMFYDSEDPNEFIADVAECLARDGVFIAQLMCLKNMLRINDLGNLAHEHLEYYSLRSLEHLLGNHGLEIFDLEVNNVNGESYRLYVRHKANFTKPRDGYAIDRLNRARRDESGLDQPETYHKFFAEMEANKADVVQFIQDAVEDQKSVWIYGASTKGNVLLQYYGLDKTLINGASDRSPEKHGRFTVGTGIPIKSEEEAREANPDFFLVLPYAFLPEFLEREQDWRARGGRFLVPLPKFRVV